MLLENIHTTTNITCNICWTKNVTLNRFNNITGLEPTTQNMALTKLTQNAPTRPYLMNPCGQHIQTHTHVANTGSHMPMWVTRLDTRLLASTVNFDFAQLYEFLG